MTTDLKGKTAYFPVESTVGLGHFNRAGKIVREMVANGMDVTVASGTFVDPGRFFAGATLSDMPAFLFKGHEGHYTLGADGSRAIVSEFNAHAREGERTRAHLLNLTRLKPDVVFSELWPFQRPTLDNEMTEMLEAAKSQNPGGLRLASIRDVLDTPDEAVATDETRARKQDRDKWAAAIINKHFDAVLVHGDQKFVDLSETFSALAAIKKPVIYTGYITSDLPRRPADIDYKTAPFLLSVGSGADAQVMVYDFLAAWQRLLKDPAAAAVTSRPLQIVCGPRFDPFDFMEVSNWAQELQKKSGFPVTVDKYRTDLNQMMANAAFSVSLAGYNTTLETVAMQVPALLLPKYGYIDNKMRIVTEQLYRLQRLESEDFARFVHPVHASNSAAFAAILRDEFMKQTAQVKPAATLDFSGPANTVQAISHLLKHKPA